MALLFIHGTNGGSTDTVYQRMVNYDSFFNPFSAGYPLSGNSMQFAGTGDYVAADIPDDTTSTLIAGMSIKYRNTASFGDVFLRFSSGNTTQVALTWDEDGAISVFTGSNRLARTAGSLLLLEQWYYIEMKATSNATTGAVEVRVNGQTVINETSLDTDNGGGSIFNNVRFTEMSGAASDKADFYVCDTTGLTNNDFLGPSHVENIYPNADGNRNNFTRVGGGLNNYEAVDEGRIPDDTTTYVHSSTVDDDELYGFAALTQTHDTIHGINVLPMFRKVDAGDRQARALIRSSTFEAEGSAMTVSIEWMTPTNDEAIFETNPNGGGAWTQAAVDAAEFGFTIES